MKIDDGWDGLLASKIALPLDLGGGNACWVSSALGTVASSLGGRPYRGPGLHYSQNLVKALLGPVLQD